VAGVPVFNAIGGKMEDKEPQVPSNGRNHAERLSRKKGFNKAQKKFIAGAVVLVGAILYLMITGINASGSYYYTVAEVIAMGETAMDKALRLEGKVAAGTIEQDTTNLKLKFNIVDESEGAISVFYEGITPDMFQENIDVVVEGKLNKEGLFVAKRLLTSCPSKYEASKDVKESI